MNNQQPSILKIIWVDFWAMVSAIFLIIVPVMYLYFAYVDGHLSENLIWTILGLLAISIFGLASRYISIVSLYNSGLEAKATISEISFFRDRGHIKYIYSFQGQKYASQMRVMKNKITTRYEIGNEVDVIVDGGNPKKSIIKDLFV